MGDGSPNVYLFVPNVIGYVRVLLTIASYYYFFDAPVLFLIFYTVAFVLDGVDGHAARYFNQCTRFGAVFDMITDRAATAGLVVLLTHLQPPGLAAHHMWLLPFGGALLIGLDLVSHYVRMYSCGGVHGVHKATDTTRNALLRVYYSSKPFMLSACLGQEGFYILFYMYCKHPVAFGWEALLATVPFMVLKQGMCSSHSAVFDTHKHATHQQNNHQQNNTACNLVQLLEGVQDIVELDNQDLKKKKSA